MKDKGRARVKKELKRLQGVDVQTLKGAKLKWLQTRIELLKRLLSLSLSL